MDLTRPQSVPEALWTQFVQVGTHVRARKSELLWAPGETREDVSYLVLRGLARLYHPGRKGDAVTLLLLGSGDLLGHHPELGYRPYATGAETLCASDLLSLPAASVEDWLYGSTPISALFKTWLRRSANRQLENTFQRIELEHDAARVRVAHTLLALDRQALLERMSRQQIADVANLSLETTVRCITQLLRDGHLKTTRFTALSEPERWALVRLLEPYEPLDLPYDLPYE